MDELATCSYCGTRNGVHSAFCRRPNKSELPVALLKFDRPLSQKDVDDIVKRFNEVFKPTIGRITLAMTTAFSAFATNLTQAFNTLSETQARRRLVERRLEFGGNQQDVDDPKYVTLVCGAWLCTFGNVRCPSDTYDLGCNCDRCHARGLKAITADLTKKETLA